MNPPRLQPLPPLVHVPAQEIQRQFDLVQARFTNLVGFGAPEVNAKYLNWSTRDGADVGNETPSPANTTMAHQHADKIRAIAPDLIIRVEEIDEWSDLTVAREERSRARVPLPLAPGVPEAMAAWMQSMLNGKPLTAVFTATLVQVGGGRGLSANDRGDYLVLPNGGIIDSRSQNGWQSRRDFYKRIEGACRLHPDWDGWKFIDGHPHKFRIADYMDKS